MSSGRETCSGSRTARRILAFAWSVVFVLGLAGWTACVLRGDPAQAWRALLVNFIFFTPLSAAMVVWPAVVMVSRGQWMGSLKQSALAGIVMAPLSLVAFGTLWLGRSHWATGWLNSENLPNRAWLSDPFLFIRDGAALLIWWLSALWFVLKARDGLPKVLAGWLAFLYGIVFSLLAFDMVMALDPHWVSTLFGAYFFVTGMYAAMAVLTFIAVCQPGQPLDRLQDLGKLIVTFSIMTTYLMFSQLLPMWYENLANEIRFLLPRMTIHPWKAMSLALVAAVYLGPLVLLLTIRAKRTPWFLGMVSLLVFCGLWVERWWLVAPTLGQGARLSVADLAAGAAFAGMLGWGVCLWPPGRKEAGECE